MQGLTQPTLLLKPFADSGDKNSIPVTNSDLANPQLADLTNGFPAITSEVPENGGLPPERKDFNGLGYLTTTYDYFYQAGGTFTFNSTISTAIGGYPKDARLWYTDSNGATTVLRSTKNDNTDNFVTTPSYIGTSWVPEIPALGWNNTWTGTNTFSGAVVLGASATVTAPSSVSDSSTKVPSTAWVGDRIDNKLSFNGSDKIEISQATLTSTNGYEAPSNGFVYLSGANTSNNSIEFTLNSYTTAYQGYLNSPLTVSNTFYVRKGMKIKASRSFSSNYSGFFFPLNS